MKTTKHLFSNLLPFIFIFFISSCKKTVESTQQMVNSPNKAPIVHAGSDQRIMLPLTEISLTGGFEDSDKPATIQWTKLSGPDACVIESPNEVTTKVSNLKEGVYLFELSVVDPFGAIGRDSVEVTVEQGTTIVTGSNEVIFRNVNWIFPWYASLELPNIYSYIPQSGPIRVFVKRDGSDDWEEANPVSNTSSAASYEYFIEGRPDGAGMYTYGSLYVFYYGTYVDDTPDVKIEF